LKQASGASAGGGRLIRRPWPPYCTQVSGRFGGKAFGAGNDFRGRYHGGFNISTEIASQRDFSRYQTARRLNDQPLSSLRSAQNAHRFCACFGYHFFKLFYIRHCGLPSRLFCAPLRAELSKWFRQLSRQRTLFSYSLRVFSPGSAVEVNGSSKTGVDATIE
jgi:hypothetical protein